MAQWDPESGKLRPTWTVRFSAGSIFLGCTIAAVVTSAVFFLTLITGPGLDELNNITSVARGGVFILGLIFGVYLLIGPVLAWGLGFSLRTNPNHGFHVIAFAILGLIVGFMIGNLIGLGTVLAPAAGIGSAVGRWAISRQSKI